MSPEARREMAPWWAEWLDYLRESARDPEPAPPTFADLADYLIGGVAFVGLIFAAGYITAEQRLVRGNACAAEVDGRALITTHLNRYGEPVRCVYLPTKGKL